MILLSYKISYISTPIHSGIELQGRVVLGRRGFGIAVDPGSSPATSERLSFNRVRLHLNNRLIYSQAISDHNCPNIITIKQGIG